MYITSAIYWYSKQAPTFSFMGLIQEILFEYLAFIYIDGTKKSSNSQVFGDPLPLFFESVSMD